MVKMAEDEILDGNAFSLLRLEAIEYLKMGERVDGGFIPADQWFNTAIAIHFAIAARKHGFQIRLSATRTEESRIYWQRDMSGVRIDGDTTPDHFKHAGFLCFWLRRRIVLEQAFEIEDQTVSKGSREFFAVYGNELCAFLAGYWLCLGFEFSLEMAKTGDIVELLGNLEVPSVYLQDVCKLLRNKEVSPHALYLIYKSLFTELGHGHRYFDFKK